jgi:hypothetical protein
MIQHSSMSRRLINAKEEEEEGAYIMAHFCH